MHCIDLSCIVHCAISKPRSGVFPGFAAGCSEWTGTSPAGVATDQTGSLKDAKRETKLVGYSFIHRTKALLFTYLAISIHSKWTYTWNPKVKCVLPGNILPPPPLPPPPSPNRGFFGLHPSPLGKFQVGSILLLKNFCFCYPPPPLEFPLTLCGGGVELKESGWQNQRLMNITFLLTPHLCRAEMWGVLRKLQVRAIVLI